MAKYYFSNASPDTSLEEMSRVCMLRWPIEQFFQEGKSELCMSDMSIVPGRPGTGI